MTTIDMVKKVMRKSGVTQIKLADMLGYKGQSGLASLFRSQDMRFGTLTEMLNACGYTIEIKNPSGEVEYSFKPEVSSDEKDC